VSHSQNGWPVASAGQQDTAPLYAGVTVPNGVLKGDVAIVFRWLAERYHKTVEPLAKGTCWGWYVKPIEGGSTISNHASGTAIDLNADQHPMGVATTRNFSSAQIKACHTILAEAGGVLRWGGDYTGRPDPMHWEIVGTASAVHALAQRIEGDLPMDQATFNKLMTGWSKTTDGAAALSGLALTDKIGDVANPNRTVGDVLRDVAKLRGVLVGDAKDTANAKLAPGSPLAQLLAVAGDVEEILTKLTAPTA
jgi:hypothetical protein